MKNNVYDVAEAWVMETSNRSDFATHEEFILALAADFERAASHVGDCFCDTAWWANEDGVDQQELEDAIVEMVFEQAAELKNK